MRLKTSSTTGGTIMDSSLSFYNGNTNDIINSPKRINTIQNSNHTTTTTHDPRSPHNTLLLTQGSNDTYLYGQHDLITSAIVVDTLSAGAGYLIGDPDTHTIDNELNATALLNNINNISKQVVGVSWCKSIALEQQQQQLLKNVNLTNQTLRPSSLYNINNRQLNNTLAAVASLQHLQGAGGILLVDGSGNTVGGGVPRRTGKGTSLCSSAGTSPGDDSVLDFEEAHQSCSSVEESPIEEDRIFDISSDTDSLSDEGNNICDKVTIQEHHLHHRGIINPNYPGFQHLAHTLDFRIKTGASDTEDDEFESTQDNNVNNNNNNNGDAVLDKIDSVNRLDSVENIQKVFYDKPVLNIPGEDVSVASSSGASNCGEDSELSDKKIDYNIPLGKLSDGTEPCVNIIGDFEKEITKEFGRISRDHSHFTSCDDETQLEEPQEEADAVSTAKAIQLEIQNAVEKLSVGNDLTPSASKYNIEPNVDELPFNKCTKMTEEVPTPLEDTAEDVAMSKEQFNAECRELKLLTYKVSDAYLSGIEESELKNIDQALYLNINVDKAALITPKPIEERMEIQPTYETKDERIKSAIDSNKQLVITDVVAKLDPAGDFEKFSKEDKTKDEMEKDEDSAVVPRKKETIDLGCIKKCRELYQPIGGVGGAVQRREFPGKNRDCLNRRSMPTGREHKRRNTHESMGSFDVYNIETAMPNIDMEAIESHLRAAREEERRRRTDREEIRRRLAMGNEDDYYGACDRPGRKPSLQARLQSGMNLQICFMNETASDTDSPSSDSEHSPGILTTKIKPSPKQSPRLSKVSVTAPAQRPVTLALGGPQPQSLPHALLPSSAGGEMDFFAKQARLQTEARMALAQAKEMARMQMEIEKQRQKNSPITEMVRHSLEKVGIPFPEDRRRLSRQILTEMNVAQLQVIVNDLHTQIEILNESLVKFLMDRDDLHMEQDSMLVDIEDLTRFLGAKEQTIKEQSSLLSSMPTISMNSTNNNNGSATPPVSPLAGLSVRPHLHKIASLVKNK